jgi:hypothetical protein
MAHTDARAADGWDAGLARGSRWRDAWGAAGNLVPTGITPWGSAHADGRS